MERKNEKSYRLNWELLRHDWPLWILMVGLLAAAVIVYPHLPEQVPGHWNIHGEIDAYYPKSFGAFFPPLMAIGLYVLMVVLPLADPKRDNYVRFTGAYTFIRWALVLFTVVLFIATILVALGYEVNIGLVVKAIVSILFLIIGNFMGQFRHNYFVGIKTPWTLASEEVWQSTHRLGAKIWVAGSLVCLAMAPVMAEWGTYVFFAAVMVMAFVPIIYSYLLFVRMKNR